MALNERDMNLLGHMLDYCDDIVEYMLTDVYVTPLHVYGNMERYDLENNAFGFTKGDLRAGRINAKIAIGAGEYVYQATDFRTIYFSANDTFWLGRSANDQLILAKDMPAEQTT